jgi:hypothetical protein
MAWTADELQDHLDAELSRVIEEARRRADLDALTFAGTVSGFLLKTGLALAAKHNAPRSVVEGQMGAMIADAYARDAADRRRRGGS